MPVEPVDVLKFTEFVPPELNISTFLPIWLEPEVTLYSATLNFPVPPIMVKVNVSEFPDWIGFMEGIIERVNELTTALALFMEFADSIVVALSVISTFAFRGDCAAITVLVMNVNVFEAELCDARRVLVTELNTKKL